MNENSGTYIIVTWNNEKEIVDCLSTVSRYSPKNSKVIVVDNNSNDRTVQIIKEKFPEIDLIESKENLGFAAANNLALENVSSEYICYLNPDVILTEDILTPSIEILEDQSEVGLVACRLKNKDGSNQPSCFNFANSWSLPCEILHIGAVMPRSLRKKYFLNYYKTNDDFKPDWVIGAEMVMRTKDARAIGGFSTEYFMYTEDMDLCKKISVILKKQIYFISGVSLIHLGGASEAQNVNYNKQKKLFQNDMIFVRKFYGESEAKRTKQKAMKAYLLRKLLLTAAYWKKDRSKHLSKTEEAYNILKNVEG